MSMSLQELKAIRDEFGLSEKDIAEQSQVHVDVVRGWFTSSTPAISQEQAYNLRLFRYGRHAEAALAASGLPECPVQHAFEKRLDAGLGEDISLAELKAHEQHRQHCEICTARDRCVIDHAGEPPKAPQAWWLRIFLGVFSVGERFPSWFRPALLGALLLFVLTCARIVFALPAIFLGKVPSDDLLNLFGLPFLAAGAGAVGGLVYSLIGKPLLRIPVVGPYLAGIVTVLGYMVAIVIVMTFVGERIIEGTGDLPIFLIVSVFFGLVMGRTWFRDSDMMGKESTKPVSTHL